MVSIDVLHGHTEDVIKDIAKKCDILITPNDVMKKLSNIVIWNRNPNLFSYVWSFCRLCIYHLQKILVDEDYEWCSY